MTTIDNNNYELWLLRYAEDELTATERNAVETWLVDHPEAAEELALYSEAPRLERDENVRYTRLSPLAPQDHLSPFTFHLSPFPALERRCCRPHRPYASRPPYGHHGTSRIPEAAGDSSGPAPSRN